MNAEELGLPTHDDLKATFDDMVNQEYNGVPGAVRIGTKDPVVCVSALTHGNEPSGLAPIWHYMRDEWYAKYLEDSGAGSVVFLVNNIEAAKGYFDLPVDADEVEKGKWRSIDVNMNRLPDNIVSADIHDARSEVRRVCELRPLFAEFDAGLDIHSLSASDMHLIMEVKGTGKHHARNAPLEDLVTNMIPVQQGIPVSRLYGGLHNRIPVVGIEAGQHEHENAYMRAILSTEAFLASFGLIRDFKPLPGLCDLNEYRISQGIVFPAELYNDCILAKTPFGMYETVESGDPIVCLQATGAPVERAKHRGHILMATTSGKPTTPGDEACFLSHPVQKRKRSQL